MFKNYTDGSVPFVGRTIVEEADYTQEKAALNLEEKRLDEILYAAQWQTAVHPERGNKSKLVDDVWVCYVSDPGSANHLLVIYYRFTDAVTRWLGIDRISIEE